MNVIDRYREGEPVELCEGELLTPAGLAGDAARGVLVEHAMEVTVNTVPTMRVVCTPDHLVDLVVGRLYTEGIVGGARRYRGHLRMRSGDACLGAALLPSC